MLASRTRPVLTLAALVTGMSLAVSGCSVSKASSGTTSPAASSVAKVATIPSDKLVRPGRLTVCVDMPFPPMQYFDAQGEPAGLDVDLMHEVSARLGLQADVQNSVFDTIIAALKAGKCDVIWADQFITPPRQQQVDMLAYLKTLESLVVPKGNPKGVKDAESLCALKAAGQTGGSEIKLLQNLDAKCKAAGKPGIDIQQFPKSPDALNALRAGHVDVWVASTLTAAYWVKQSTGQFEVSSNFPIADSGTVGISFNKQVPEVEDAVKKALGAIVQDGTYDKLFAKYGLDSVKLQPQVG